MRTTLAAFSSKVSELIRKVVAGKILSPKNLHDNEQYRKGD